MPKEFNPAQELQLSMWGKIRHMQLFKEHTLEMDPYLTAFDVQQWAG